MHDRINRYDGRHFLQKTLLHGLINTKESHDSNADERHNTPYANFPTWCLDVAIFGIWGAIKALTELHQKKTRDCI